MMINSAMIVTPALSDFILASDIAGGLERNTYFI